MTKPVVRVYLRIIEIHSKNYFFLRQSFTEAFKPVLELTFIEQADIKLTEFQLPLSLPPKCWE